MNKMTADSSALLGMKARIVPNLLEAIEAVMPDDGHRHEPEFLKLANRIQGKVVRLRFIGPEAFEANDDNYWLPDSCWEQVPNHEQ